MNTSSLRTRITSFYVTMLAFALVVFSAAVYYGVRTFLTRSLESNLRANAKSIVTNFVQPMNSKPSTWFVGELTESYPPGISDTFVRVSRGGQVLYQTGDIKDPYVKTSGLPLPGADERSDRYRTERANGQRVVLYTLAYPMPDHSVVMVETGESMAAIEHTMGSLFMVLLLTTPLILLGAAVGGYVLMSGPLRPVVRLTEQAERVGRIDLGERLPVIATGDELERLSLSLNRMIDRLEETVAHNCRFSADASHELRTPLTIIRGELEMLLLTPHPEPDVIDGVNSALEECTRMSRIVESLMAISRLDGGERMDVEPVDLAEVTRITLDQLMLLAVEKGIALRLRSAGPVWVMGDAMRLKQVVVNLVDNAIKYTPNGGEVEVTVSTMGGAAVLNVLDTGMGIPAESLPHIFERFYRADEVRSRASGGTGLGLAIVRSICTAHQGIVTAKSESGAGSTFRVELPLVAARPEAAPEAAGQVRHRTTVRGAAERAATDEIRPELPV